MLLLSPGFCQPLHHSPQLGIRHLQHQDRSWGALPGVEAVGRAFHWAALTSPICLATSRALGWEV